VAAELGTDGKVPSPQDLSKPATARHRHAGLGFKRAGKQTAVLAGVEHRLGRKILGSAGKRNSSGERNSTHPQDAHRDTQRTATVPQDAKEDDSDSEGRNAAFSNRKKRKDGPLLSQQKTELLLSKSKRVKQKDKAC
jgi:hypothetical protein